MKLNVSVNPRLCCRGQMEFRIGSAKSVDETALHFALSKIANRSGMRGTKNKKKILNINGEKKLYPEEKRTRLILPVWFLRVQESLVLLYGEKACVLGQQHVHLHSELGIRWLH
ncbi:hypothetical protein PoB_003906300 [Plakobranchus ocellatus]|uniref:Uncharacterized protein n=1 Tax=Plakobranchus ocellatus TaxID=259542 RepID=A0AAV4B0E2_9GAST|nr:hypothetical protein PoB_003906300 [Plakobranchus ocellatus]